MAKTNGTAENPIVEMAEYAIRHFAGKDIDRETARKVLPWWSGYEFITRATRDAVLARFPEPEQRVVNADFYVEQMPPAEQVERALTQLGVQ